MKTTRLDLLVQIIDRSDLGMIVIDNDLRIQLWNDWMHRYSGRSARQVQLQNLLQICPELKGTRVEEAIINTLLTRQSAVVSNVLNRTPFELHHPSKHDSAETHPQRIQQAIKIVPLNGDNDVPMCMIQINDVSASVKRENILEQQVRERRLVEQALSQERALFIAGPTVVFTFAASPDRKIDYVSPNILLQFGYQADQLIHGDLLLADLIHPENRQQYQNNINHQSKQGESVIEQEFRIKHADGGYRWVYNLTTVVRDENKQVVKYLGYLLDITERKSIEEKIEKMAYFDELTGLANRRMFMDRLNRELARAKRHHYTGALFFIDLDRFKAINDTLGHDIGDLLLKRVAELLQDCLREEDTAARIGGDEFVIILPDLGKDRDIATQNAFHVAEKLRESLGEKHIINGNEVYSTPSIGIVTYSGDDDVSTEDLIRYADTAMYRAKNSGRNKFRFFNEEMQQQVDKKRELEQTMRSALTQQQFSLNFQPLFNRQHEIIRAEALVRWQHPEKGWISPADFIPLAEESGMILTLGDWVLSEACRQLKTWQDSKLNGQAFTLPLLAVNVSPKQFRQPDFVNRVKENLQRFGISPKRIEIELTEGIVIADVHDTIRKMQDLKELGVHIAIDDFGTGYSSLAYLKNLPIDVLKIDQSFVRDITCDRSNAAIVSSIISMAKHLGLSVIAEGVETAEELNHLSAQQCDIFQGYFFSKPLTAEDFCHFYHQSSQP
jgi:diguanylate cyclase (GGDEF)-like protein/PAS domain S-box-containing protein